MRIEWDQIGQRYFKTGTDRGVLYPIVGDAYVSGVAWNGLSEVSVEHTGFDAQDLYVGHSHRGTLFNRPGVSGRITAYTYPDEFDQCIGSSESDIASGVFVNEQDRAMFGLCFRTFLGNDTEGTDHGYELHILYQCDITGITDSVTGIKDAIEAAQLSWDFVSYPIDVEGYEPTCEIIVNSTKVRVDRLTSLENILYGSESNNPTLLMPNDIFELLCSTQDLVIAEGYPSPDLYGESSLYPINPESGE